MHDQVHVLNSYTKFQFKGKLKWRHKRIWNDRKCANNSIFRLPVVLSAFVSDSLFTKFYKENVLKYSKHVSINQATTQSLELCEKRGECPGLPIPKSPHGLCRCKATTLTCRAQDLFVKDSLFTKFHKENALTCGKHVNIKKATTQSSELFERRGGHSGLPIPKRL